MTFTLSTWARKTPALAWLLRQRPQTVLLFVIVMGGGYSHLIQLPGIFDRALDRLEMQQTRISLTYEKDQDRDENRYQRLERMFDDALRARRPVVNHNKRLADVPL